MKLNHSVLIVSIASAVVIIGASITLGLRFSVVWGLLVGVGAFTLLIACMLFANSRMNKKTKKKTGKKKTEEQKTEE